MSEFDNPLHPLGAICLWPGGYAVTLGEHRWKTGVLRCCEGHKTPDEAKTHGLVRLGEMAARVADSDAAWWAEHPEAAAS